MSTPAARAREVLDALERDGTKAQRDGMARYGIPVGNAYGVSVADLHVHAKRLGRDHALSEALWDTGRYEARLLAAFTGEPELVTATQMDRWAKAFDSWAVCDTVCLHLFDRAPHAWRKVAPWCRSRGEFVRRAGFALLAALAIHDKAAGDEAYLEALPLVEEAADDDRNFVRKGVNWALRSVGQRNVALHTAAIAVAERLAAREGPAARWIGKDALRDLRRPLVLKRLAAREQKATTKAARAKKPAAKKR